MVIRSRRLRWTGHVARMREMRNVLNILVGKSEAKRRLGIPTPTHIRGKNFKMDIGDIVFEFMDWIHLAQKMVWWRDLVNAGMKLHIP
jgi:hypothetical protein